MVARMASATRAADFIVGNAKEGMGGGRTE